MFTRMGVFTDFWGFIAFMIVLIAAILSSSCAPQVTPPKPRIILVVVKQPCKCAETEAEEEETELPKPSESQVILAAK